MPSNTAGSTARQFVAQTVHTLRKKVRFDTPGVASGVKMPAPLPAGAEILRATAKVKTAFNAATTNVLTVGTSAGSMADVLSASDVTEGTPGAYTATTGAALTLASDTDIYVKYTQTGTAATAGEAIIIIEYVPNNDQ